MNFRFGASALLLAVSSLAVSNVQAAGFEKNVVWGAKEAGTAGIGSPKTTGARALYFNPAGLVQDEPSHEFTLDGSPSWSQFTGPINYLNQESTSAMTLSAPFSAMYGGAVNNSFGWGIGYYVSGGNRATFDDVPFVGTTAGRASAKTNLTITEVAVGFGYRVMDELKIGVAWRGIMADGEMAMVSPLSVAPAVNSFMNLHVNGLKAANFGGFKLGAQYDLSKSTVMSFVYRSEAALNGDGKYGGVLSAGTVMPVAETDTTSRIIFPMAATLGIQHDFADWSAMAEYVWTQYSAVNEIVFDRPITLANGTPVLPQARLETNWRDQHSIRLGSEYTALAMPVRLGYVWTSQVTDSARARATFTPPGLGHTFTAGTGYDVDMGDQPLKLNAAVEYTFASGIGEGAAAGQPVDPFSLNATRGGEYRAVSYALHLGLSYAF